MRTCSINECNGEHVAKGFCAKHYARLLKHGDPMKTLTAERGNAITYHGYKIYGRKKEHISIAEKAFGGKLPKGSVVHHADYNKLNNENSNLVVCSIGYHKLIHQRTDAYNACGNANWRKCKYCKKYDDPKNLYINGTSGYHRECHSKRNPNYGKKRGMPHRVIEAFGKSMTVHEWCEKYAINKSTFLHRLDRLGWSAEEALSTPPKTPFYPMKEAA